MRTSSRKINQQAMYKQLIASNIFNDKSNSNKENKSLRKYSNLKNEDHFKSLNEIPKTIKVKTGKTFKRKPSTDVLNVKKKKIKHKIVFIQQKEIYQQFILEEIKIILLREQIIKVIMIMKNI